MVIPREELEKIQKKNKKRRRTIWLSITSAVVVFVIAFVLVNFTDVIFGLSEDLTSTTPGDDWTMFRRDLQHTGNKDISSPGPEGVTAWTYQTGDSIHSSPAVVDGVVYFGSRDSHIYALNAETGEEIWKFKTGSWVESSPIVAGGVLYCGSNDGHMYAVNVETGEEIWRFDAKYPVRSSAAIANGKVYFGADDWSVYAVNIDDGTQAWNFDTDNIMLSSPLVVDGVVAIGGADGYFYCINAENGGKRLKFEGKSMVVTSPVEKDGTVYFINSAGFVYAIDPTAKNWWGENTLKKYWDALYIYGVAPKPPMPSGYVWSQRLGFGIDAVSSASIMGETMYLGANGDLLAMDLPTGDISWHFSAGDSVTSSPALSETAVYFGSYDGTFYAIDRSSGEEIWQISTGGRITSSAAIADGMAYVGSHDGILYAFK